MYWTSLFFYLYIDIIMIKFASCKKIKAVSCFRRYAGLWVTVISFCIRRCFSLDESHTTLLGPPDGYQRMYFNVFFAYEKTGVLKLCPAGLRPPYLHTRCNIHHSSTLKKWSIPVSVSVYPSIGFIWTMSPF